MSRQQLNDAGLALSVAVLIALLLGGGASAFVPVESPFPAEGLWLLAASESKDFAGVKVAANAETIRKLAGPNRRWLDYDKKLTDEPWKAALAWAKERSGGKPYFVVRNGSKAREGFLEGSGADKLATLREALEEVR